MYHRVLIPERDQRIHRYLWKNMDREREHDVYVKTVLTFGDKPVPAITQVALGKTADEVQSSYAHVAKVLKENT